MSKKSNLSPVITLAKKRKAQGVVKGEKVIWFLNRKCVLQHSAILAGLPGERSWTYVCEPKLTFRMRRHWMHCLSSGVRAVVRVETNTHPY